VSPVTHIGQQYQFYLAEIDVHVLVENHCDGVIVRASCNVSERRKAKFIRHLAAEGHIPDHYQWCAETASSPSSHVQWIVDSSWLGIPPELTRRTTRFMRRLIIGGVVLWVALFALIVLLAR